MTSPIQNKPSNIVKASKLIDTVLALGVRDFCLCAGARNSPLISLLDENKSSFENYGHLYHFFDERSAGFFALGCSQRTQNPVAIITTSGTAVSELLSSAIEAYYTQTPLIFITADRPPQYRGTGAPQSIEQIGIFSNYTLPTIDINDSTELLDTLNWDKSTPLHLNICFNEPLLDGPIPKVQIPSDVMSVDSNVEIYSPLNHTIKNDISKTKKDDSHFYLHCKNPLFIVSGLNVNEKIFVSEQLSRINGFWHLETLSGLRGHPSLEVGRIKSGYQFMVKLIESKKVDGIIRIGSVPTTRLWRDLEEKYKQLPVVSLSSNSFSGLSRSSEFRSLDFLKQICDHYSSYPYSYTQQILCNTREQDFVFSDKILQLLNEYPESQLNLVRKLSILAGEQPLYLGNSLPIRDWDMVASPILSQCVSGNRGANGIDGQLSTFFGWRPQHTHSWALLGDLTTLYDLNAPWILPQQVSMAWTLAVMNNSGGQIFKPMFNRDAFLNRHNLNFEHWAKMWNLSYHSTKSLSETFTNLPQVLEIFPCPDQSKLLNQQLDALWKTL